MFEERGKQNKAATADFKFFRDWKFPATGEHSKFSLTVQEWLEVNPMLGIVECGQKIDELSEILAFFAN